jgi:ribosomal protein S18 acetylase RimI-like enzyme
VTSSLDEPLGFSLTHDDWLTERFGYAAWRVVHCDDGEPLSRLDTEEAVFAHVKVDVADVSALWRLIDKRFRIVDVNVTLDSSTFPDRVDGDVRFAAPSDCDAVARIAGSSFPYSRFHLDPLIASDVANTIKSEWARSYFSGGRGDGMVVAEWEGNVVGFAQLLWQTGDRLVVDLIGVDPTYRGQGVGRSLIAYACKCGTGDGHRPGTIQAGTQVANISSIRFYESMGFCLIGATYVLHHHGGRLSGLL